MSKVEFALPSIFGREVSIVGDFNDWRQNEYLLEQKNYKWWIDIELKEGIYQYKFLVDNKLWLNDPTSNLYAKIGSELFNSVVNTIND